MLARSVENIFWLGRYLERLDDTARLVNATSHLLIDSHKDTEFGWPVLLEVMGQDSAKVLASYGLEHQNRQQLAQIEQAVMQHLISNIDSPVSIRNACSQLRYNARTIRQLLPRDMWEELNKLDSFVQQQCVETVSRQQRYQLMTEISRRCQMVIGTLDSVMLRGDAFDLFTIGRHLERADMVTRIMDVMVLQTLQPTQLKRPRFRWISILNALGGAESYQYYIANNLAGAAADAIDYLLCYADFPRSVSYCLHRIAASGKALPNSPAILQQVHQLQHLITEQAVTELSTVQLHQLIDQIQTGIIDLHQVLVDIATAEQQPLTA
ncbi:alpha-E domain-containing protein [Rheinheimera sp. UJ63]|uniref:alpha-E domain-containing protein n=1 Tax=Rheinheimera sp. UJ63 TaxID=2910157 RepID=UPI001F3183C7|nr:alpha-E domain-containing protein [Rheinheimera sp. UJ63]MCF4009406.1 alpha-E domain-containing protein [Rheinheimera sp. UJ63]